MNTIPDYAIIFGAGASFGSGEVYPKPPPMTTELLEILRRLFPAAWGALPEEILSSLRSDFEVGMREVGEKSHALPILQRTMAKFFFGFYPRDDNLYVELAQKIKGNKWNGALITLNYERLLELALIKAGVTPFSGEIPEDDNIVEICFPHGCCHIFCETVRGGARSVSFSGLSVKTSGAIKVVSDPTEYNQRINTDAFPPVMSYYTPEKPTTSGVDFIELHRSRYKEVVENAKIVVLVGLKVRPHDEHIWDPIADTDAEVVYCSGSSAGTEFEAWLHEKRIGKANKVLNNYFRESFEIICKKVGLD